ncbi:MAG TPA: hypothetical protein VFP88_07240 [Rhodanobacteraceae bacterium]|nr:hypothetical protein [Rhodanobacteraceae bacterium]
MNLTPVLRALGVTPLRLRARPAKIQEPAIPQPARSAQMPKPVPDKRIALLRAQAEIERPALATLYTKITEAISALGLQCVRMADAENDPRVRVLAFGDVPLPPAIEPARVLSVDTLATLEADRARKRALWELMQTLAREAGAGAD